MPLHLETDTDLYADDTISHTVGKTTDVIEPKLQVRTCDFYTWCAKNNMGVHHGKTHTFVAGSEHMTSANGSIAVAIHEHTIESVSMRKHLGILINKSLTLE